MSAVAAGMESDSESDCEIVFSSKVRDSNDSRVNSCNSVGTPKNVIYSSYSTPEPSFKNSTDEMEQYVTPSSPEQIKRMKRNYNANITYNRQRALRNKSLVFDDLRYAILQGSLTSTKNLYETHGIQTDTILKSGWTGLMYACSVGHTEIVEYLLQRKANPNFHRDMFTPLMAVCISKKYEESLLECCSLVLKYGANVNVHERHRTTPLIFAAREGHTEIVKTLLENSAERNANDSRGYTALAWAAYFGHGQVVRILLEKGADRRIANNMGQLPADIAYDRGHVEVARLLQNISFTDHEKEEKHELLSNSNNNERKTIPSNSQLTRKPEISKKFEKVGELELFLIGIDCQDLITKFNEHHLTFHDILIMSDEELEKIGIFQAGLRKKILEASKAVHKKEWQISSLPNLKKNHYISCPDAVSMLANISKHLKYISTSVVYVRQQIQSQPRILELSKESANVHDLMDEIEDSLKNVHSLKDEIRFLKMHIVKNQDRPEYSSADLIVDTISKDKCNQKIYVAVGIATISIILAGIWYKYPEQSSIFIRIPFLK